ncbi:hypothetical protein [Gloeobacter kilaueensis]|uniref:Uncharacterized protein n=1 Tax=Gloeobacter kilaueensis (strain ATCC BAA-2537 / CCAP 1431/1 / ULC 316 / JS1) TaxID=1183438 RepID=U5QF55_GLOK1|nr:hypothetical protein [Gloeobacter kilaueensis]AGY57561.1 hypothetical protein GKIL_1315 [Gloeobacter kilaueensis JS1]
MATEALKGSELIDCAKANADLGMQVACERCGYGRDEALFFSELKRACAAIGIELEDFDELVIDSRRGIVDEGVEIAPDSTARL